MDWCAIFGKDRATREGGSHFGDALQQVLHADIGKNPISTSADNGVPVAAMNSDDESDFMSAYRGEIASSLNKKTKKYPTKRPCVEIAAEGSTVNIMTKFFETSDSKLDKLVDEMASNVFEHTSVRNKVFNSLKDLHHLTMTDKMKVTSAICDRKDFEIFLTPTPENTDMLIKLIMDGQY